MASSGIMDTDEINLYLNLFKIGIQNGRKKCERSCQHVRKKESEEWVGEE